MSLLALAGPTTALLVICAYLLALVVLGVWSSRGRKETASEYFVASRGIGPFLLLMSVFGTTMTAFAMVGSTAKSYDSGIGVYGLMASSSGLIHSLVFFVIGIRLWAIGKRHGFLTQIQFFRARYESNALGYLLFPILVLLVVPYLLVGLIGAGSVVRGATRGLAPEVFTSSAGGIPPWLTGLGICSVVLFYIFAGGLKSAAVANAFQTIVFMLTGFFAFVLISRALGGMEAATQATLDRSPEHLAREGLITHGVFLSYMLVPLSVGMFPHLFQHWLTARSAKTFRLTVVAHPLFIMVVWIPCILMGIWATGMVDFKVPNSNQVLARMVNGLLEDPLLTGILTAGILAAIMSSLDSQFVCLGTIFTQDIVVHMAGKDRISDRSQVMLGRGFIVLVVTVVYLLSLLNPPHVFDLGVWCFSGFAALFPLVFASLYWRRTTKAGAFACVIAMAASWLLLFNEGLIQRPKGENGEFLVLGLMPVAIMIVVSAAALVIVSLMTKPPAPAVVDKFFIPSNDLDSDD